jgi:hypothetical protein
MKRLVRQRNRQMVKAQQNRAGGAGMDTPDTTANPNAIEPVDVHQPRLAGTSDRVAIRITMRVSYAFTLPLAITKITKA